MNRALVSAFLSMCLAGCVGENAGSTSEPDSLYETPPSYTPEAYRISSGTAIAIPDSLGGAQATGRGFIQVIADSVGRNVSVEPLRFSFSIGRDTLRHAYGEAIPPEGSSAEAFYQLLCRYGESIRFERADDIEPPRETAWSVPVVASEGTLSAPSVNHR